MPNLDTLINFGSPVKALNGGKVGGHLVLFGSEDEKDLAGEWFTAKTDYEIESYPDTSTVRYQHDLDPALRGHKFAKGTMTLDGDVGIWLEVQLNMADEYEQAIFEATKLGKLGWSSGTATHLVDKSESGEIKRWPLKLDASLTPTPCDPRQRKAGKAIAPLKSLVMPLKSMQMLTLDELLGTKPAIKSAGISANDKQRILQDALCDKVAEACPDCYMYAWVCDVFDATVVYRLGNEYYEAPYTFNGTYAEIGEGVESVGFTQYRPVVEPAESASPGMKVPESAESALAAVKAFVTRARDIRALRSVDGRDVSHDTLNALKSLHAEIAEFLSEPPPVSLKGELKREMLRTFRPRTTTGAQI